MPESTSTNRECSLAEELQQLRSTLQTDQNGLLTATRLRLARLAWARRVEPQTIEDVVQETLLEAWRCLDRLHEPAGFDAWIDEICRNVCRRTLHRQRLDLVRNEPLSLPSATAEHPFREEASHLLTAKEADPLEELSRQDWLHLLNRTLGLLPQETRRMVEMCYFLELPRAEMAQRLGITSGTLDVRLHRARRKVQQILHGPLRSEAEAMGLVLEKELMEGWQSTRLWCPLCAEYRLQGCFVRLGPEDDPTLHIRCPQCSRRYGQDTVHSMGLVPLSDLRSFRPAWKRTMQGVTDRILQALSQGYYHCFSCQSPALIQIKGIDPAMMTSKDPYLFRVYIICAYCGKKTDASGSIPTVDQLVYWSHPRTRQFLLQHPRTWSKPVMLREYEGASAICFQLVDRESADQITVVAQSQNLHILALF